MSEGSQIFRPLFARGKKTKIWEVFFSLLWNGSINDLKHMKVFVHDVKFAFALKAIDKSDLMTKLYIYSFM